jgi:hypothetical protein
MQFCRNIIIQNLIACVTEQDVINENGRSTKIRNFFGMLLILIGRVTGAVLVMTNAEIY